MKTIDEMIAVMTAYKEGKKIEYKDINLMKWEDCVNPLWEWRYFDYRIKPEEIKPTYRPYQSAEELDEAIKEHGLWLRIKGVGTRVMICGYGNKGAYIIFKNSKCSFYDTMFKYYEWLDGTPFGRRVEE